MGRRIAFRWAFVYFGVLFCAPVLGSQIPLVNRAVFWMLGGWTRLCLAVGHHLLHLPTLFEPPGTGSGDRLFDWVVAFTGVLVSVGATLVWSIADRRRPSYPRLWDGLRSLLRYTLGVILLGYGVIKLFGGQFPAPDTSRLIEPFGESSPMGLMWTFMGASHAYVVFAGAGETLGALLVLFRRTATLGALVLIGVLTNVVMMNLCYDVPVKLMSSTYLAMAILVAAPDLGRLFDLVVLHRAVVAPSWRRTFSRRWMRVAYWAIKLGFIGLVLFDTVKGGYAMTRQPPTDAQHLHGSWLVKRFVRDGQALPAIVDDKVRWKRFRFQAGESGDYFRWLLMDGTYGPLYEGKIDEPKHLLTFKIASGDAVALSFAQADANHLQLTGKVAGAELVVEAERLRAGDSLLLSRGFHLISEAPFNR